MKIASFRIQEHEKKECLAINVEAETQQESSLLISVANRFPIAVKCYGRVGPVNTWAWIFIPLTKGSYRKDYFGNEI